MLITTLLMTGLLTGSAHAVEPDGGQDSVVATAPATTVALDATAGPVAPPVGGAMQSSDPHGLDTDQQIARWLAARTPDPTPASGDPLGWRDDRKPHGEISVGIGTGGYRDYAAAVSLPIGENGRLDLSVRQVENGYYPYGYGRAYGYDPYFMDSGYAFPGQAAPGAALEYERRMARPEGPPNLRPAPRPLQAAEE
jgi:hypothetical protein